MWILRNYVNVNNEASNWLYGEHMRWWEPFEKEIFFCTSANCFDRIKGETKKWSLKVKWNCSIRPQNWTLGYPRTNFISISFFIVLVLKFKRMFLVSLCFSKFHHKKFLFFYNFNRSSLFRRVKLWTGKSDTKFGKWKLPTWS